MTQEKAEFGCHGDVRFVVKIDKTASMSIAEMSIAHLRISRQDVWSRFIIMTIVAHHVG